MADTTDRSHNITKVGEAHGSASHVDHTQPDSPGIQEATRPDVLGSSKLLKEKPQKQRDQRESSAKRELDRVRRDLDEAKRECEAKNIDQAKLREQFAEAEQDIATLRDHVKFHDEIEPPHAISKLDDIRTAVDNISWFIVRNIRATVREDLALFTTDRVFDFHSLQRISTPPPSLWKRGPGEKQREIIPVLVHSLAAIIILHLDKLVFALFHPGQTTENSQYIEKLYVQIRKQEPQVVSGPMRVNIFKAIDLVGRDYTRKQLIDRFVNAVRQDCAKIVAGVFGIPEYSISDEHMKNLESIYLRAHDWHHMVKSKIRSLDYHVCIAPSDAHFDGEKMTCIVKGNGKPSSIICAVGFGLCSSRAIGKERDLEIVWQQKIAVLSALSFQSS